MLALDGLFCCLKFWCALLTFTFIFLVISKILVISSKNKATKERVERLCKSKELFEERLGLEIRRIHSKLYWFLWFPNALT